MIKIKNFRLSIQYDGSRYKGWQRLGDNDNTIQGKIEDVLSTLSGKRVEIIGSSRTDAGVHALNQTANVKLDKNLSKEEVFQYLNKYLPKDIAITAVTEVPNSFHARYNAVEKVYQYKIWNRYFANPFMRKYSMHIEDKLDIIKMKAAAEFFKGEHDFTAFSNAKSKKKSMVRSINSLTIDQSDGFICITISGNGFLYNMVRRITGVLIEVGSGRLDPDEIPNIINSRDRSKAGYIAEPCGLHLVGTRYNQ